MAHADSSYTFGDTPLAAARLELLGEVFRDATTAFLSGLETVHPRLAVDPPSVVVRNEVVPVTPPLSTVARMFAMNFEGWRTRATVMTLADAAELKQVADGLEALTIPGASDASIAWELRELVLANRPTAGHRVRP